MPLPAYPSNLPGVASLELALAPRRRAATAEGGLALGLRLRQVERQWAGRATWGALTAAEAVQWRMWWQLTLRQGCSLFMARLPMPGGPQVMVCRLAGPPRFEWLPGGYARVECPMEVRAPVRGPVLLDAAHRPLADCAGRPLHARRALAASQPLADTAGRPLSDTAGRPLTL